MIIVMMPTVMTTATTTMVRVTTKWGVKPHQNRPSKSRILAGYQIIDFSFFYYGGNDVNADDYDEDYSDIDDYDDDDYNKNHDDIDNNN